MKVWKYFVLAIVVYYALSFPAFVASIEVEQAYNMLEWQYYNYNNTMSPRIIYLRQ